MPNFDTPGPISVELHLNVGVARITAGRRAETVVEVSPGGPGDADKTAAEQTLVEFSGGKLLVRAPKKRGLFGSVGAIDVSIELPAGSNLVGDSAMGSLYCVGELGACEFKTEQGEIKVEQAGRLRLNNGHGDVTVGCATGEAEVRASGEVRLGSIEGTLTFRNSNGATNIKEITGSLRANASNGDITVGRAHSDVTVHSTHGSIRVGEVTRGLVDLKAAAGDLEVGVGKGSLAWLDVSTRSKTGSVHNSLGAAETSVPSEATVQVQAVTGSGDVVIRPA
ncbi:DUF4097 family beta strand repeat-containing protein [Streptomyces sp. P1-3]|uniref:DUF4097 family beta strand repeat-containing protein n=1 Tax=Streptomyces sp. P1-3 TaxID=3421658 RepID=UPI003D36D17F